MNNFSQFTQFFNSAAPSSQFPAPGAPPAASGQPPNPGVDQLTNQLEYSFIDIPDLISLSDEEEEQLPPAERQRRRAEKQRCEAAARQAALQRALAGQGVVNASGFDPTPYQQHLAQLAAQQQQLAAQQQQQAAAAAAAAAAQQQQAQQAQFQQQQQYQQPPLQQQQPQGFGFGHFPPGGAC
ncbi:hypothetical protein ABPG75_010500 [Micractinium tetrahymenae]